MGLTQESDHIIILFSFHHFQLLIHKEFTEHVSTLNASMDNTEFLKLSILVLKLIPGNKAMLFASSLKGERWLNS